MLTRTLAAVFVSLVGLALGASAAAPETAQDYLDRGQRKLEEKDWDGAIAEFDEAVRLAPGNASAYCSLGLAKLRKGQAEAAIAALDVAITLDGKLSAAYLPVGTTAQCN
jgi:tetratricopeptide (TPR) repeat protein